MTTKTAPADPRITKYRELVAKRDAVAEELKQVRATLMAGARTEAEREADRILGRADSQERDATVEEIMKRVGALTGALEELERQVPLAKRGFELAMYEPMRDEHRAIGQRIGDALMELVRAIAAERAFVRRMNAEGVDLFPKFGNVRELADFGFQPYGFPRRMVARLAEFGIELIVPEFFVADREAEARRLEAEKRVAAQRAATAPAPAAPSLGDRLRSLIPGRGSAA